MALLGYPSSNERQLLLEKARKMEQERLLKKQVTAQARREQGGLSSELSRIRSAVIGNQRQTQMQQNRQQVTIQQNFQQPIQRERPRPPNFFEHKDEVEVYGDEGLTFFDSKKSRGGESTGSLFGI